MRIARATLALVASALLLSGCGSDKKAEETVSALPEIDPVTQVQESEAARAEQGPSIRIPEGPDSWGENVAESFIEGSGSAWAPFSSGDYDPDTKAPMLGAVWLLVDDVPEQAFVTITVRPHGFAPMFSDVMWGDSLRSTTEALLAEAGTEKSDVSQDQSVDKVSGLDAWLVSGFGTSGSNVDMNFAYVTVDDGLFFYTFRLTGTPESFDEHKDEFLSVVYATEFEKQEAE